ncbi:phage protein [Pseudomonas guariconensis]|uniref:phage protein n=1 Tax=Pseudomonas guariconensis TaxID=1288410 RepID=UPI002B058CAD|nr:phage protein [Pseudomonas guariconensis]
MLAILKHYIENPEDIPPIPASASEFLKVRLNPAYLISTGVLDELRKTGMSERAILGFIEGVNAAVEVVELMEYAQMQRLEDEQIT